MSSSRPTASLSLPPLDARLFQVGEREILRPVYTLPLHEFQLVEELRQRDIPCYLPLRKAWSVRNRTYKEKTYRYTREYFRPLFPSYLFVKVEEEQRGEIFRCKNALRILPVTSNETLLEELKLVRQLEEIAQTQELEFNTTLREGDRFLMESGPWQGVYGWLRRKERRYLWLVEIQCLNGTIQATIDPSQYTMTRVE